MRERMDIERANNILTKEACLNSALLKQGDGLKHIAKQLNIEGEAVKKATHKNLEDMYKVWSFFSFSVSYSKKLNID